MTKQAYSRDEVKALLREAINSKQDEAVKIIENKTENSPEQNQKTYTHEEVVALIKEDRKGNTPRIQCLGIANHVFAKRTSQAHTMPKNIPSLTRTYSIPQNRASVKTPEKEPEGI